MDGFTRLQYPDRFKEMKRASWDMMLDHRLSPDDISRFTLPDIDDLLYARERGMNLFNILNIVPEPKDPNTPIVYTTTAKILFSDWFYPSFRDRVVPFVAKLKEHGLAKMAYIYGFDEQEKEFYPAIDMFWRNLKRDAPGIPLMSTSRAYRDIANGVTNLPPSARSGDWFCPLTANWKPSLSEELKKEGKKVWWYTCCGPGYPSISIRGQCCLKSFPNLLRHCTTDSWSSHTTGTMRASCGEAWVVHRACFRFTQHSSAAAIQCLCTAP